MLSLNQYLNIGGNLLIIVTNNDHMQWILQWYIVKKVAVSAVCDPAAES